MKKYVGVEDGKIIWNDQTGEPVCTVDEAEQRRRAELYEPLVEALEPFARFAREWKKNPTIGNGDPDYPIAIVSDGTKLRTSDCITAAAILARCAEKEG